MTTTKSHEKLRLRPHHILCERFAVWDLPERGETYNNLEGQIRDTLRSETHTMIEFVEGIDELCEACPLCQGRHCGSPQGGEDAVRKWDTKILEGLGVWYGDIMPADSLSSLIREKAPLAFCSARCRFRDACGIFSVRGG